jgi:hypothetical protein
MCGRAWRPSMSTPLWASCCREGKHVQFNPAVYDLWVFRRSARGVEFLVLHTSQAKADRHFNGGRFWQIISGFSRMGNRSSPQSIVSWRHMD